MKKWTNKLSRIVLVFSLLFATLAAILPASEVKAVTRELHWVGGTAAWDGTAGTKWSLTEGGASGEAIPDSDDNVYFDAGSGVVTVTFNSANNDCLDLICTGYAGAFAGTSNVDIYGSMTLAATITSNFTPAVTFKSTAAGKTVTTAGKTFNNSVIFNGVGGGWTLQDALYFGTVGAGSLILQNGTLDTNGQTVTAQAFVQQTAGTLTLGASSIVLGSYWRLTTPAGFTLNAGTSHITVGDTVNESQEDFVAGGKTYHDVTLYQGASVTVGIDGAGTFNDLEILGINEAGAYVDFSADQVIGGTLTMTGLNDSNKRLRVRSSALGTTRQLTAAAVSITNCNIQDISGVGAASWDISAGDNADAGGNYHITFTVPQNNHWVGTSGSWSDVTHWASTTGGVAGSGRVPLLNDTAIFDIPSIITPVATVTMDITEICSINALAVANTPTFTSTVGTLECYGSLYLGTVVWNPAIDFNSRLSANEISSMSTMVGAVGIDSFNQITKFTNDVVMASTLTLTSGVLDLNDQDITAASFVSTSASARYLYLGNGAFLLNGTGVITKWNVAAAGLTVFGENSTIYFSNSGVSTQTFASAGLTYNNFVIMGAGNYATSFTGNPTFGDVYVDRSVAAKTISGAVTIAMDNLFLPVSGALQVTITNTDFIQTIGTVAGSYMTISGSTAAGGATFLAGIAPPSVDGGGNVGWSFTDVIAPTVSTAAATALTLTGATLNGAVTNMGSYSGSTIYAYFEYGIDPTYSNTTTEQPVTAIGTFDDPVTGLSSDTLYYYRAAVRYSGTSYVYGAQLTFTTLGAPLVTTIAASDITAVSAALQGLLDTGLTASVYVRFDYGYDTSFGLTTPWQTFNTDTAFNAFVYNLQPSTTYHYRAVGLYGAAVYVYGGNLTFITTDGSGTDADQSANRDRDVLPEAETSDWFLDPDIGGTLLTNPFRPLVTMVSDNTTLDEIQVWRFYALAIILFFTVLTAKSLPHHLLITGIVAGALIWGFVALTIFPGWALLFAIGGVIGGLVAERTGQL